MERRVTCAERTCPSAYVLNVNVVINFNSILYYLISLFTYPPKVRTFKFNILYTEDLLSFVHYFNNDCFKFYRDILTYISYIEKKRFKKKNLISR